MVVVTNWALAPIFSRFCSSRAFWHTAQGAQKQCTQKSPHGSFAKLYFCRKSLRLPLAKPAVEIAHITGRACILGGSFLAWLCLPR